MWKVKTPAPFLLALAITACVNHATPIYNVERSSFNSTEALDASRAEQAIKAAGSRIGWNMETLSPGLIRGTLNLREHVAVIDINYDGRGFSIDYVDSENLNYDEATNAIHKSYNKWIGILERRIRAEAASV